MSEFFATGGFMMWPILVCGLIVLGLAMKWSITLFRGFTSGASTPAAIDAILFWGAFAFILGVLGTTIGIVSMAQAIESAGAVSSMLIWEGVRVVLTSTLFGLSVLTLALIAWFVLRVRHRRLVHVQAA